VARHGQFETALDRVDDAWSVTARRVADIAGRSIE
jgi:hypothetical protein